MNVEIAPRLAENKALRELVEAATPILERAIGNRASVVSVKWDCGWDEQGQTQFRLTLSDWTKVASANFSPEELRTPEISSWRFIRLYGDLLEDAASYYIRRLEASLSEEECP